jgi:hypothetical protein
MPFTNVSNGTTALTTSSSAATQVFPNSPATNWYFSLMRIYNGGAGDFYISLDGGVTWPFYIPVGNETAWSDVIPVVGLNDATKVYVKNGPANTNVSAAYITLF